jgi:type II secretory pathway component PulF
MSAAFAERLEALADCLESGASPAEAIAAVESAGGAVGKWAAALGGPVRAGQGVAAALARIEALRPAETALLQTVERHGSVIPALRWIAARRRARVERAGELVRGAAGPLFALLVTILTIPLPQWALGGSFWRPIAPDLALLAVAIALVAGVIPALVRHPRFGPRMLGLLAPVPGLGRLVYAHAEAELATALAALVESGATPAAALGAAADLVPLPSLAGAARSQLPALLVAADGGAAPEPGRRVQSARRAPAPTPLASEPLRLALVAGSRAGDLTLRLRALADRAEHGVTRRLRAALRALLFIAVVAFGLRGLSSVFEGPAGFLNGNGALPGVSPSDMKELDDALKDL